MKKELHLLESSQIKLKIVLINDMENVILENVGLGKMLISSNGSYVVQINHYLTRIQKC